MSLKAGKQDYVKITPFSQDEVIANEVKPQNRVGLKILGAAFVTMSIIGVTIYIAEKKGDEVL